MSRPSTKKKTSLLEPINSRAVALEAIQQSAIAFVVVGVLQGILGLFLSPTMLIDAFILIALGLLLAFLKSRVVALVLLPLAIMMLVFTILNSAGLTDNGGTNVFLGLVVCWAALRAVEATFKLHGRFAHEPDEVRVEKGTAVNEPQPPQTKPRFTTLEWGLLVLALLLVMVLLVVILLVLA